MTMPSDLIHGFPYEGEIGEGPTILVCPLPISPHLSCECGRGAQFEVVTEVERSYVCTAHANEKLLTYQENHPTMTDTEPDGPPDEWDDLDGICAQVTLANVCAKVIASLSGDTYHEPGSEGETYDDEGWYEDGVKIVDELIEAGFIRREYYGYDEDSRESFGLTLAQMAERVADPAWRER